MKTRQLPDKSVLYFDAKGVMQSHELAPGILLHVREGVMSLDFARVVEAECERQIQKAKRCVLMVDGYETTRHTTEFRELMTKWFRNHPNAVVHMLARSQMVTMALRMANLEMGAQRAITYFEVEKWEAACRAEIPTFRRRPLELPKNFAAERAD